MGFKIKTIPPAFRGFTANLPPINLTAGVPIAELYFGLYGVVQTAGQGGNASLLLNQIDELRVSRGGQVIVELENGQDLFALMRAPWNDQSPDVTAPGTSGHYTYVKGLMLPCNYPSGAAGEFILEINNAASAGTISEEISIAEGQGDYAANYFGQSFLTGTYGMGAGKQMFHIVKRLIDAGGTGWRPPVFIGTDGTLIGLMVWVDTEQCKAQIKSGIGVLQFRLDIGGESVIEANVLNGLGTQGSFGGAQNNTSVSFPSSILGEYYYIDFRRQPWDCRGKSVRFSWNAGTDEAARLYPIYLIDS